jgi:hypothetical protein
LCSLLHPSWLQSSGLAEVPGWALYRQISIVAPSPSNACTRGRSARAPPHHTTSPTPRNARIQHVGCDAGPHLMNESLRCPRSGPQPASGRQQLCARVRAAALVPPRPIRMCPPTSTRWRVRHRSVPCDGLGGPSGSLGYIARHSILALRFCTSGHIMCGTHVSSTVPCVRLGRHPAERWLMTGPSSRTTTSIPPVPVLPIPSPSRLVRSRRAGEWACLPQVQHPPPPSPVCTHSSDPRCVPFAWTYYSGADT